MLAAWTFALLLLGSGADKPTVANPPRVRAARGAERILHDASQQSITIRELVDRLAATDVIVYVEITPSPQVERARTKLVTATPTARFLRIGISSAVSPFDAPILLGHELQHAVEIAECADVRDDAAVRRLYARIGRELSHDNYETDAATRVERRVRAELQHASRAH